MNTNSPENEAVSASPAAEPETPAPAAPPVANVPPAPPPFDPRRRIRELLSIPERDRTDAEWDELNELEIQTAPGNRVGNQPPAAYGGKPSGGPGGMPAGAGGAKNRFKGNKPRKPGPGGPPTNRPPQQGKPNHKPRPT